MNEANKITKNKRKRVFRLLELENIVYWDNVWKMYLHTYDAHPVSISEAIKLYDTIQSKRLQFRFFSNKTAKHRNRTKLYYGRNDRLNGFFNKSWESMERAESRKSILLPNIKDSHKKA